MNYKIKYKPLKLLQGFCSFILLAIVMNSCDSSTNSPCDCDDSKIQRGDYHNTYYCDISSYAKGTEYYWEVLRLDASSFKDLFSGEKVNAGNVYIAGFKIEPDEKDKYILRFNYQDVIENRIFGKYSDWGVEGNPATGIPRFITSIYMPTLLTINEPRTFSLLNYEDGLTLSWDPDTTYQYKTKLSCNYSTIDDEKSGEIFSAFIPDIGSYFISLDSVPPMSNIYVTLERKYSEEFKSNGRIHLININMENKSNYYLE